MGKTCVIMEESICVGQAMFIEMKTGDLENDAWNGGRCQRSKFSTVHSEHRVPLAKDCAFWSPWRFLPSRRWINQDWLVQREIFIVKWLHFTCSGSPCCESFSRMSPQERASQSCGSISVIFAGMKGHRASWIKQDQQILFPFSETQLSHLRR